MVPLKDYKPEKIIVRMPNWIGDLVMATPVLTDLRRAYPNAHITAMCRTPISDLLREDRAIDELFTFSKINHFGRRNDRRDIILKLKEGKYDLGVLLTHSFSSAWWFWLGNVKRRLGYKGNGRGLLLTDKMPLPENVHEQHLVETYKMLLEPLGIPLSQTRPHIDLTEAEIANAKTILKQRGITSKNIVIGINPGATYGSAKCWLPERFREVTERLIKLDKVRVIYFGDQSSIPLVKEICQGFPSVVNMAGITSIRELAGLIKECQVILTNDSGPMHLAVAVGTPLVALFGSTNDTATGPYKTGTVIHKHVSCSPCYKRVCPIDFRCMKQIESDEVYNEIMHIINTMDK